MKLRNRFILIFLFFIIYMYVCNILFLPSNVVAFEGEKIEFKKLGGLTFQNSRSDDNSVLKVSTNADTASLTENVGVYDFNLKLFGMIPVKEINVEILPKTTVIPVGKIVGLKLYTSGVLVVGLSVINGQDGKSYKPYENSIIEEGDMIISMNNVMINNIEDLSNVMNGNKGESIEIVFIRHDEKFCTKIEPVLDCNGEYKLGLWVRDAAAGVGTCSFVDTNTKRFAVLGHSISDIDTGEILNISNGELVDSKIIGIQKGANGAPGEIQGILDSQEVVGNVDLNTDFGIFGNTNESFFESLEGCEEYEVALRSEIKTGMAEILCEVEEGKIKKYKIEILKVYSSNNYDNKSMLIKITDKELLEKTGGIIQGMSGSPIIQNGKFIGAVTHVLVKNSTEGFAVFGDLMVKKMMEK